MKGTPYEPLLSDEVFIEGALASDVRSLWSILARTPQVVAVAKDIASDPERIRELCRLVDQLTELPHAVDFRHPQEMAICAAILIVGQSPLGAARNLLARLKSTNRPSFAWVRRMADYCDEKYAERTEQVHQLSRIKMPKPSMRYARQKRVQIQDTRYALAAAS